VCQGQCYIHRAETGAGPVKDDLEPTSDKGANCNPAFAPRERIQSV
jgi:hypothetical protein